MKIKLAEPETIKDEIKVIKFETGVTARHIGDLVGVTPATVWNWMAGRGEPSASQMDIIRGFFVDEQKKSWGFMKDSDKEV